MCPPSKVREILAGIGGKCVGKSPLSKAIMEHTGCCRGSAYRFIENAIGRGISKVKEGKTISLCLMSQ